MTTRVIAGASGYSFKEWKGPFYPEKMKPEEMLPFYSARLPTVEINNTFYQMPKTAMLENWLKITPEPFRFAIKASKRITHLSRLKPPEAYDSLGFLYKQLETLGAKRGPVLFQLPPNLKKDLPRLEAFLKALPPNHQAAFEFRNEEWFCDETYAALKSVGASLCLSEREDAAPGANPGGIESSNGRRDAAPPPLLETAPWGYVRLRLENYSDDDLKAWADRLLKTGWQQIYVYFMHEPTAPAYAESLMRFAR
jgi:uncharacterized protein YecE (DUF72 family)